ncbi:MAG: DUF357 domain-containing protein [Candidatus Micrarchaeota archaeon]|nr:DUF357 domain-containing protein [Candidatus Micrarchaeota archaeon]MCX8154752.1 DUF357 domain-containing protein [Candidatus Micrarchaeota archaeon]
MERLRRLIEWSNGKIDHRIYQKAYDYFRDAEYFLKNRRYYDAIAAADYAYGLLEGALLERGYDISHLY